MEIERTKELALLQKRLKDSSVVAILGPRQCGKTTLAHQFARRFPPSQVYFFDLEDPRDLARLENPMLALEDLSGFVIIDEIQRRPDLFPVLRVLVDRNSKVRFLILGSASRDLIAQSSETLAGRMSFLELTGFTLDTFQDQKMNTLWIRGGFPRSFLAKNDNSSFQWRQDFITTFLERDIPNLGIKIPPTILRRFWMMLTHFHGQIFNASEIGRSLSTTDTTVKRYLDILSGTFLIRQIQPWFLNTQKRLVKRPKIYFRDSGLLHALFSIVSLQDLHHHPKLGASWEGFALEQAIQHLNLQEEEVFFWATHGGAEIDFIFQRRGSRFGIECKYHEAPRKTKSMHIALDELALSHLWVIYPGGKEYLIDKKISVIPLQKLSRSLKCV